MKFTSPTSEFYNLNIKSGSGTIDMGEVRQYPDEYSADLKNTTDLSNNIHDISIANTSSPNIKLPFNCKFNSIDLSNAASVSYTVLKLSYTGINVDSNNIIRKDANHTTEDTYGDYTDDSNLGVMLPQENGVVDTGKIEVTEKEVDIQDMLFSLSTLATSPTYNKSLYCLSTNDLCNLDDPGDLSNATDSIAAGESHTYNFGFIETTPIQISGNGTAIFNGDNSGYGVVPSISVAEVEFGNKSLFQFSYNYTKGIFKSLQELKTENPNNIAIQALTGLENIIPEGKTVTFTGGFTLGKGHTLIVRGTLIG